MDFIVLPEIFKVGKFLIRNSKLSVLKFSPSFVTFENRIFVIFLYLVNILNIYLNEGLIL